MPMNRIETYLRERRRRKSLPYRPPSRWEKVNPFRTLPRQTQEMFYFLFRHLAVGVGAAVTVWGGILIFDIAHIRSMAMNYENPFIPLALLLAGLVITFGSVAMGWGIMSLGEDKN